ncbi:MAG: ATP-binding protein [Vicinamibacterales bacterium]
MDLTSSPPHHPAPGEPHDSAGQLRSDDARRIAIELDTIIESMRESICVCDADGSPIRMNRAALALHGFSSFAEGREQLRTLDLFDIRSATGEPIAREQWPVTLALQGSAVIDTELRVTRRDTGKSWLATYSCTPVLDADGRVMLVVVTAHDVTARREAEARDRILRAASALALHTLDVDEIFGQLGSLVVGSLADWVLVDVMNDRGEIQRFSAAHRDPARQPLVDRLTSFPVHPRMLSPEVIRTGVAVLVPQVSASFIAERSGTPEYSEALQALEPRSIAVVPVRVQEHVIGSFICVRSTPQNPFTRDDLDLLEVVAQRVSLAIQNARLFHQAQEANRFKDEFIATLSHELRTPLNAILGWTSILKQGGLPPEQRERALTVIERNAQAQAQLLGDILDVNRIVTGKITLDTQDVMLAPLVERVVETMRPGAIAKSIRLHVVQRAPEAVVLGDPARLQQIVWNLLSNAIKFTPLAGRVTIMLDAVDRDVLLSVSDTGAGISPAFLPHVFDRFRQADSSSARRHTGLGLGLAIVKHLAELHGGVVSAESQGDGRGATFVVRLPQAVAQHMAPALPVEALPDRALAGTNVLVVDDHDDSRDVIRALLMQSGALVTTAASTAEAVLLFRNQPVPVALIDISMPGEDGYACLRQLQEAAAALGVRFAAIAFTAHAQEQDRQQTMVAGFAAHLAKPVQPEQVLRAILNVKPSDKAPIPR